MKSCFLYICFLSAPRRNAHELRYWNIGLRLIDSESPAYRGRSASRVPSARRLINWSKDVPGSCNFNTNYFNYQSYTEVDHLKLRMQCHYKKIKFGQ